jgi:hypothetical protein
MDAFPHGEPHSAAQIRIALVVYGQILFSIDSHFEISAFGGDRDAVIHRIVIQFAINILDLFVGSAFDWGA